MTQMEQNPLSIRHVVVAEFREFDCQDGRLKKGKLAKQFHILWNLTENILKFSRNLSCEILLYISTMICQNRNSFSHGKRLITSRSQRCSYCAP